MPHFICTACGTQYPDSATPPAQCVICEEERQYVPPRGQSWTTLDALRVGHFNSYREYENGLIGFGTQPQFAIGQRALLLRTPGGNVLWDCISLLDAATVTMIKSLGGVAGHRHLASAFLHVDGGMGARLRLRRSICTPPTSNGSCGRMRRSSIGRARRSKLWDGVTLIRCGGHFEGGTVLHWAGGADGRGLVCSGDILTVCTDRKWLVLHAQLSEFHPAVGARGHADRAGA